MNGVLYFDFGSRQFPVKGWNDFVVVIARWWIDEFERISKGGKKGTFRFMDGPYWVSLIAMEKSKVLLQCIEDRDGIKVVYEAIVEVSDLRRELSRLAMQISVACTKARIESNDVDHIKRVCL